MDTFTKNVVDLDGIIVALNIPFAENEEQSVDYEKLRGNVLKYQKWALKGKTKIEDGCDSQIASRYIRRNS